MGLWQSWWEDMELLGDQVRVWSEKCDLLYISNGSSNHFGHRKLCPKYFFVLGGEPTWIQGLWLHLTFYFRG